MSEKESLVPNLLPYEKHHGGNTRAIHSALPSVGVSRVKRGINTARTTLAGLRRAAILSASRHRKAYVKPDPTLFDGHASEQEERAWKSLKELSQGM